MHSYFEVTKITLKKIDCNEHLLNLIQNVSNLNET